MLSHLQKEEEEKQEDGEVMYKNKKKGQATVESVLLMVLLLSLATLILKTTMYDDGNDENWIKKIVGTPGAYIRGMSIAGVWKECKDISQFPAQISNCSAAIAHHPNHIENSILQTTGQDAR